jgi:hypothetical protein
MQLQSEESQESCFATAIRAKNRPPVSGMNRKRDRINCPFTITNHCHIVCLEHGDFL